mmetsp:Transcript_9521/g.16418  ORF Transcript_9521/g.16418 Transcript_9521/m.16418 type:complete len:212 (-) Transcript_9521:748-1383(-)
MWVCVPSCADDGSARGDIARGIMFGDGVELEGGRGAVLGWSVGEGADALAHGGAGRGVRLAPILDAPSTLPRDPQQRPVRVHGDRLPHHVQQLEVGDRVGIERAVLQPNAPVVAPVADAEGLGVAEGEVGDPAREDAVHDFELGADRVVELERVHRRPRRVHRRRRRQNEAVSISAVRVDGLLCAGSDAGDHHVENPVARALRQVVFSLTL